MSSQAWVVIDGVMTYSGGVTSIGNLLFSPDNTYDIGASGATRPRNYFGGGNFTIGGTGGAATFLVTNVTTGGYYVLGRAGFMSPADGVTQFTNNAATGFTRLILGMNDATTNGVSLKLNSGNLELWSGDGSSSRGNFIASTIAATATPGANGTITAGTAFLGPGTVASTGDVRLQEGSGGGVRFRLHSNLGDTIGLYKDTSDVFHIADSSAAGVSIDKAVTSLNGITATGNGVPIIVAQGRQTAQTGAVASVATYTPTADGSFLIDANFYATTATSYTITMGVAYTDENGNSRSTTLPMMVVASGAIAAGAGTLVNTNGPQYAGIPIHIRARANTAITVSTSGTFTTVTYNVECTIRRLS